MDLPRQGENDADVGHQKNMENAAGAGILHFATVHI